MKVVDRLRIESAVLRYDFWLEMRGVRGRRRRELRSELRGNLAEATADAGATRALFGIGSPKQLAYAAQPADPSRPRWSQGLLWATAVFVLVFWGFMATLLTVLQTVEAAQVTDPVEVHTFPWFGTTFTAQHTPGTINAGFEQAWALLVLPLLTLLFVAQPWRLLRGKQQHAATVGAERI